MSQHAFHTAYEFHEVGPPLTEQVLQSIPAKNNKMWIKNTSIFIGFKAW